MKIFFVVLLFLLFCVVDSYSYGDGTLEIRPFNGTAFSEIGKSFTFECVFDHDTPILWYNNSVLVARCEPCNYTCKEIAENNRWGKAFATCDPVKRRSLLRMTDLISLDHTDFIGCQSIEKFVHRNLLVGSYSKFLQPQNVSDVPILGQDFSLVCQLGLQQIPSVQWFNEEGKITANFIRCYPIHKESIDPKYAPAEPGQNLTCSSEENVSTLTLSPVEMKHDGTLVGCMVPSYLYLYKFTVHVPVETVKIESFNDTILNEGTEQNFTCLVNKSKPIPRIEWEVFWESGYSRNVTSNAILFYSRTGNIFESKSVLSLKLSRSFKAIQCKATVANLPWVESEIMELDIKYDDTVYLIIGCLIILLLLAIFAVFFFCRMQKKKRAKLDSRPGYQLMRKETTT